MSLDTSWLIPLSGVLGSLVGGSMTVATTWVTQKTLSKRELLLDEMHRREALYAKFLGECAKQLVDAFAHHLEKPETMLPVYALINRIRLSASRPVLVEAEHLLQRITDQYFASPLTVDEVRRLTHSADADPLKAFGEACRAELKAMRGRL